MSSTQLDHKTYAKRLDTPVELAVKKEWASAGNLLQRLASTEDVETLHVPELAGAIFCGHLVADLDSIAGAIGAAALYGGTPARASDINSETEFALEYWGYDVSKIQLVDDILAPGAAVCLVDFQQTTQLNPAIKENQIVGVIDHHALQSSTIVTNRPIYVDIRPWGSMSTIIAHSFVVYGKALPKEVAGLLLCAILSDTLNLRSPTTTAWDRKVVSLLVQYTGVSDVNQLCAMQFKAKSKNLAMLSAYALVSGDLKQFKMGDDQVKVAFAVIETTDSAAMLARVGEIVPEMRVVRSELGVKMLFVAIVDIVELQSHVVIAGNKERSLASAAGWGGTDFPLSPRVIQLAGSATTNLVALPPGKVSRKADFIPPLSDVFAKGWRVPMTSSNSSCMLALLGETEVVMEEEAPAERPPMLVRRQSSKVY
ncbi:hypothetical protein CTAYLR_010631 [Chrysophaeum taylorii]|uniref:inorganic diphosphatase n=1 Tax=Chrysophaeum taylorii TaxID=2483200 RepID=A0AAD7XP01_9STRA|nr:hypothetical protein CTAYLR_010631 [Chrysophaeum taylorii]